MTRRCDTRKARQPPEFIPNRIPKPRYKRSDVSIGFLPVYIRDSQGKEGKRLHDTAAKVALAISMAIRDSVPGSAKSNYVPRTAVILMHSLPTAIQRSRTRKSQTKKVMTQMEVPMAIDDFKPNFNTIIVVRVEPNRLISIRSIRRHFTIPLT
jgi:hypothetical protein